MRRSIKRATLACLRETGARGAAAATSEAYQSSAASQFGSLNHAPGGIINPQDWALDSFP
jgi:hypothetical protein